MTFSIPTPFIPIPFCGPRKILKTRVAMGSYATGGEHVTPSALGMTAIEGMFVTGVNTAAKLYNGKFDREHVSIVVETAGAEVANAVDLSLVPVQFDLIAYGY